MRRLTSHSTQQSSDTHNGEVGGATQGAIVGDSLAPATRISTSSSDGLGALQGTFLPTQRLETSRSSAGRSSSGTLSPSRRFTKLLHNLQKLHPAYIDGCMQNICPISLEMQSNSVNAELVSAIIHNLVIYAEVDSSQEGSAQQCP